MTERNYPAIYSKCFVNVTEKKCLSRGSRQHDHCTQRGKVRGVNRRIGNQMKCRTIDLVGISNHVCGREQE